MGAILWAGFLLEERMTDKIKICNQALLLLGENTIQDLDEDTTEAKLCNAFYDDARDSCLRDMKPNFARRRSGDLVNGETPTYGWDFAGKLPEDFLCLVEINRDFITGIDGAASDSDEWRVEGGFFLSNRTATKVLYISSDAPEAKMDSSFVKALAAYLASEIAYGLTNATTKVAAMMALYGIRRDDALAIDGQESSTVRTTNDQLSIVR